MKKVLFVGSFFDKNKHNHLGGQMYACTTLINSKLSNKFKWILLDTTSSKLSPSIFEKIYKSIKRLMLYKLYLFFKNPDRVLIFSGNGLSFLEKGFMVILASIAKKKVILAPRGGPLDNEIDSSSLFKKYVSYVFSKSDYIICQGNYWKNLFKKLVSNHDKLKLIPLPSVPKIPIA